MPAPILDALVPPALAKQRLDRALPLLAPAISRTRARKLIEGGSVFVDKKRVRVCSRGVTPGQRIEVYELAPAAPEAELRVVLEVHDLAIVDKPAGMAVEPTRSGSVGTVIDVLSRGLQPALATHRLDAPTSGLLIVARTSEARAEVNKLLAERVIDRRYLAAVAPAPAWEKQTMSAPLDGQDARTHAEVVARAGDGGAALLAVTLETGRTRQIRRHLAGVEAPVIGDASEGGVVATRLCLHAWALDFTWRGAAVSVRCPPPGNFLEEMAKRGVLVPDAYTAG